MKATSRKPYLLRALVDWAEDNGLTPLITVRVDPDDVDTLVPMSYVSDGHITLNISQQAMDQRDLGNDFVTGFARFSGRSEYLKIPLPAVQALMVRETGEGMAFPDDSTANADRTMPGMREAVEEPRRPARGRPNLRLVK